MGQSRLSSPTDSQSVNENVPVMTDCLPDGMWSRGKKWKRLNVLLVPENK